MTLNNDLVRLTGFSSKTSDKKVKMNYIYFVSATKLVLYTVLFKLMV